MKCPNCGYEFDEGSFCPECGTRVVEEVSEPKEDVTHKEPEESEEVKESTEAGVTKKESAPSEIIKTAEPIGSNAEEPKDGKNNKKEAAKQEKKGKSSPAKKIGMGCLIVIIAVVVLFVGCAMLIGGDSSTSSNTSAPAVTENIQSDSSETEGETEAEEVIFAEDEILVRTKLEMLYAISEYMNTASGRSRDIYGELVYNNDKKIHIVGATVVDNDYEGYMYLRFENDRTLDFEYTGYDALNEDDSMDLERLYFDCFAVNFAVDDTDRSYEKGDILDIICDYYTIVNDMYISVGRSSLVPAFDEVTITVTQTNKERMDYIREYLSSFGVDVDTDPDFSTDEECKDCYYTIIDTLDDSGLSISEIRKELYESDLSYHSKAEVDKMTDWECIEAYNKMTSFYVIDSHNLHDWLREEEPSPGQVVELGDGIRIEQIKDESNEIYTSGGLIIQVEDAAAFRQVYDRPLQGLIRYEGTREPGETDGKAYRGGEVFSDFDLVKPDVKEENTTTAVSENTAGSKTEISAEDKANSGTGTKTKAADDDYILPESDSRYYTKDELKALSSDELRLARNEIYARHGRIFDSADLDEYFRGKSWYEGTIPAAQFDENLLNVYEKANAEAIKDVENGK